MIVVGYIIVGLVIFYILSSLVVFVSWNCQFFRSPIPIGHQALNEFLRKHYRLRFVAMFGAFMFGLFALCLALYPLFSFIPDSWGFVHDGTFLEIKSWLPGVLVFGGMIFLSCLYCRLGEYRDELETREYRMKVASEVKTEKEWLLLGDAERRADALKTLTAELKTLEETEKHRCLDQQEAFRKHVVQTLVSEVEIRCQLDELHSLDEELDSLDETE